MTHDEIKNIVFNDNLIHKYVAEKANGEKEVVRLFLLNGNVYKIPKGKKKYGFPIPPNFYEVSDWKSLAPCIKTEEEIAKRMIKRAKDAYKYLSESGLWSNIKKEIEYFLAHQELAIEIVKDKRKDGGFYSNVFNKRGEGEKYHWMRTYQVFEVFMDEKCWMTIPWNTHITKPYAIGLYNKALNEGTRQSVKWRNQYDNTYTIEERIEGEQRKAWLSKEYKNCGNGHYGLLFDATHAIFYEDD